MDASSLVRLLLMVGVGVLIVVFGVPVLVAFISRHLERPPANDDDPDADLAERPEYSGPHLAGPDPVTPPAISTHQAQGDRHFHDTRIIPFPSATSRINPPPPNRPKPEQPTSPGPDNDNDQD